MHPQVKCSREHFGIDFLLFLLLLLDFKLDSLHLVADSCEKKTVSIKSSISRSIEHIWLCTVCTKYIFTYIISGANVSTLVYFVCPSAHC